MIRHDCRLFYAGGQWGNNRGSLLTSRSNEWPFEELLGVNKIDTAMRHLYHTLSFSSCLVSISSKHFWVDSNDLFLLSRLRPLALKTSNRRNNNDCEKKLPSKSIEGCRVKIDNQRKSWQKWLLPWWSSGGSSAFFRRFLLQHFSTANLIDEILRRRVDQRTRGAILTGTATFIECRKKNHNDEIRREQTRFVSVSKLGNKMDLSKSRAFTLL